MLLPLFAAEREVELAIIYRPYDGPFNHVGCHDAWDSFNIDRVLAQHGYVPGRPPRGHPCWPQYLPQSPLTYQRKIRSAGFFFRPIVPKTKLGLLVYQRRRSNVTTRKNPQY
jgi:hypothetical protein